MRQVDAPHPGYARVGVTAGPSRRDVLKPGMGAAAGVVGMTACGAVPAKPDQGRPQLRGGSYGHGATGGGLKDTLEPYFPVTNPYIPRGLQRYEPLLQWNAEYQIESSVAESVTPNGDNTQWTVRLRDGVEFHHGKTPTPDDVVCSLAKVTDLKKPGSGGTELAKILELNNSKIVDSKTIMLPLNSPYAVLDQLLVDHTVGIVPADIDVSNPVGTGPFEYRRFLPGQLSQFARHENCCDGPPFADELTSYDFADDPLPEPLPVAEPSADHPAGRQQADGALRHRQGVSEWPYSDPAADRWCRDLSYRAFPTVEGGSTMNRKVIITCALTGAGDTVGKSEYVPVTPEQIAESGIEAARAGAAIVHVHVRDPRTGDGTREVALYREVVERMRASGVDVVINTTAGMGGDLFLDPEDPSGFAEGTDLVSGIERLAHVEELLPDICTLDCGSLNFGEGSLVYVSTPDMLRAGAKRVQELGVRPELEIFDSGHLWFANKLVAEGLIDDPPMYQLCMGIPYGAPAEPALLAAMAAQIPPGVVWASFAIGRMQMPWVAQSVLLGGHVRVGLEDNLYLGRGHKVTNAQQVANAVTIITAMGAEVATPDEAREMLKLRPRTGAA